MAPRTTWATPRSSPGGLGLGAETSSRASSTSAASLAARKARTSRSGETERVLVARPAGTFDPVVRRPADALPRPDLGRRNLEQPARLVERGLEVLWPVLAEVAVGHAGGDLNPLAAD